jgi:hypothetical protein
MLVIVSSCLPESVMLVDPCLSRIQILLLSPMIKDVHQYQFLNAVEYRNRNMKARTGQNFPLALQRKHCLQTQLSHGL